MCYITADELLGRRSEGNLSRQKDHAVRLNSLRIWTDGLGTLIRNDDLTHVTSCTGSRSDCRTGKTATEMIHSRSLSVVILLSIKVEKVFPVNIAKSDS